MNHCPSRYDNPFATCWTRPGAIPFRFTDGQSIERLVAKVAEQRWRGAIIGPHGSGKSTLLETLKPALRAAGCQLQQFTLRPPRTTTCGALLDTEAATSTARLTRNGDRGRQAVSVPFSTPLTPPRAAAHAPRLIIIDGYEQLNYFQRLWLAWRCRRRNLGLLVTAHAPTILPTIIQLAPDYQVIHELVADLAARSSTPIAPADVDASHACHGSNVREILFDLYDQHERLRRAARTGAVQLS